MIKWLTKYRKIVMITLVLVIAIIVLPIITYCVEYKNTKVDPNKVFSIDSDAIYKSNKEYEKQFSSDIYCTKYVNMTTDGDTVNKGEYAFTMINRKASTYNAASTSVTVQMAIACDWADYTKNEDYNEWKSSSYTVSISTESTTNSKEFKISNVTTPYPQKGKLWFTTRKTPDLFIYIKWTEKDPSSEDGSNTISCYTIYRMSYKDYISNETKFN